uniref:Uncharacterized protein n=1 Tax=Anopheles quadriannulatus TaxID=34691 RepID=A0A182XTT0_ANOQN
MLLMTDHHSSHHRHCTYYLDTEQTSRSKSLDANRGVEECEENTPHTLIALSSTPPTTWHFCLHSPLLLLLCSKLILVALLLILTRPFSRTHSRTHI